MSPEQIAPFAQDLDLHGLAKTSKDTIIGAVRRYAQWASEKDINPLHGNREDLVAYLGHLRSRKLKKNSLNRNFSALAVWYDYLEELGQVQKNPIKAIQKKYLRQYKQDSQTRKIISVEQAANMVRSTIDTRDRAILLLFLKTGIRLNELVTLDVDDIDLDAMSMTLKPTAKRTNRELFFDKETAIALARWLRSREMRRIKKKDQKALFIGYEGERLKRQGVVDAVIKAAERVALHDPDSNRLEDRFTPHCCRHWFTTHLIRAGMPRDFVKELRGDVRHEAIDIYNHIDKKELKESYLAHIPQLGI
jgi:integrase/recombinase XerD